MLYGFTIAPSINRDEGTASYCDKVVASAQHAVSLGSDLDNKGARWVCEYLDLVDARTLTANQPLYRQCTEALTAFLVSHGAGTATRTLLQTSFAAQTLYELIRAASARASLPERQKLAF